MLAPNRARTPGGQQVSLAQINAHPAAFNRQVAMYLSKHVGGWSTTKIGRFYNGRDHSTVCHAIQRIEALRESHPAVDSLLTILREEITAEVGLAQGQQIEGPSAIPVGMPITKEFLDALADRLVSRILARIGEPSPGRATQM